MDKSGKRKINKSAHIWKLACNITDQTRTYNFTEMATYRKTETANMNNSLQIQDDTFSNKQGL